MGLYKKKLMKWHWKILNKRFSIPLLEFLATVISCGTLFGIIMVQTTSPSLLCNVIFPLIELLKSVKVKEQGKVQNVNMFQVGG